MTRQKSEDRIRPKSRRKSASTREAERRGGGKAVPVNEQTWQLGLPFGTENGGGQPPPLVGVAARGLPRAATYAGPKPEVKNKTAMSATMEEVVKRLNLVAQAGFKNQQDESVARRSPQEP